LGETLLGQKNYFADGKKSETLFGQYTLFGRNIICGGGLGFVL
jgi:hypothetical protein